MRLPAAICILSLFALTACDPAGSSGSYGGSSNNGSATPVSAVECDAAPFQYLLNSPIELASEVYYAGVIRVVGPDDFLPKDFDPSRLTITTRGDRDGDKVGRIFCG